MSVQDNINNGVYENKTVWPKTPVKPTLDRKGGADAADAYAKALRAYEKAMPAHREARDAHRAEDNRLREQFRADLEAEYGLTGHPKADKLWALAWEDGHSSGFNEVALHYDRFAELVI